MRVTAPLTPRRTAQEYKELSAEQSREFVCEPLEARGAVGWARSLRVAPALTRPPARAAAAPPLQDNIFEWHFVLRGPRDTEFEARPAAAGLGRIVCGCI